MSRSTIDFGIDLGTTNSALALLDGVRPVVIKNNRDQDTTPSAVSIKKDGAVLIGERARGAWVSSIEDAHIEFKRRMGTDFIYEFKSSQRQMKPEELSAEVLKSLRADALAKLGEDVQAAVITIPAAFELHQCDATKRAAQIAGFKASPLLQEPVAAALACGFQAETEKSFWMVYDFGGGTFDAALIKAEDGIINVVNHGGDNFLGGSDIDWAIVDSLVIPRLTAQYDLPDFRRGNKRWEVALRKLKRAVENAKIELSRAPTSSLDECRFEDAAGNEVEVDFSLSATDVARVAEPIIHRSIAIFQKVLNEKKLSASALNRVILVGGPTKAAYFRDQLRAELGIELDLTVDPMTAVAQGAAIFAGTQRLDPKIFRAAPLVGEASLELQYKPVSYETDPLVAGRASLAGVTSFTGYTIEFINKRSQWRSGKLPLKTDGAFMATLLAERGERNAFAIELRSSDGSLIRSIPDQIDYTIGSTVEEQPLTRSIGVEVEDNKVEWFFEKGSSLPQRKRAKHPFITMKPLSRTSSNALIIPLLEGECEAADRNRKVGELRVTGAEMKRDLPAGAQVEITLSISESRLIRLDAYVPTLDQDFTIQDIDLLKQKVTAKDLEDRWEREQERIQKLTKRADVAEDRDSQRELQTEQRSPLVDEIKREISAAATDPDSCEKADKRLLEFALKIDVIEERLSWPTAVTEVQDWMNDTESFSKKYGTPSQQKRTEALSSELEAIVMEKDTERLKRKRREIIDHYFDVIRDQKWYWVEQFQHIETRTEAFSDPARGSQLITQGRAYLASNNLDGLRNTVYALWRLLPYEDPTKVNRGFGSTVARGA